LRPDHPEDHPDDPRGSSWTRWVTAHHFATL
jgi:hypothetical protein